MPLSPFHEQAREPVYRHRWGGGGSTVMFISWDEVLFPTRDLFLHRGLRCPEITSDPHAAEPFTSKLRELAAYSDALETFLTVALGVSDSLVILCDRAPGWVEACVEAYLPRLVPLFLPKSPADSRRIRVVYVMKKLEETLPEKFTAREKAAPATPPTPTPAARRLARLCGCLWGKRGGPKASPPSSQPILSRAAHLLSMKVETEMLASQRAFHGAISIGTKGPQQDAFGLLGQVLDKSLAPSFKTVWVPSTPTLEQLTLRLRFDAVVLPVYTIVRRSFHVDMSGKGDALNNLAAGLRMPRLSRPSFPRSAWHPEQPVPNERTIAYELAELRLDATDAVLFAGPLV